MDKQQNDYDSKAGDIIKFDKLLKEATIGYYKTKIWGDQQLPAVWGQINDREITLVRKCSQIKSVVNNFDISEPKNRNGDFF